MQVGGTGDGLTDYVVGHAMLASRQKVQAVVATKTFKAAKQAAQSVLQLLDAATQTAGDVSGASASLTAKVSGSGCNLDTYA